MKLVLVSPYPPSKITLTEYAFHLVEQLKNKDQITELIILSSVLPEGESYPKVEGKIPVKIIPVWSFNSYTSGFHILKTIKKLKADMVLFNLQFLSFGDKKIPATLGLLVPMITKLLGIPSVVLLHNIIETVDYGSAGITKNKWLQRIFDFSGTLVTKILLQADLMSVTIPKYVHILEEKYKAKNVALIPHGSFESPVTPKFDEAEKPLQVMTFGKFGTYKKVEKMIEAVQMVRERSGRKIEIVIAGTDNPNVKGYLKSVEEKYKHLSDIRFTGYVEEEDVPTIFNDCTISVFPYTSTTGSSGVLHQAGTYGKAVVLPNIGDLKSLIEDEGYKGLYFEPGDTQGMADSIETLLFNDVKRKEVATANFVASSSLPMEDMAEWFLLHFDHLQNKKNKKHAKEMDYSLIPA